MKRIVNERSKMEHKDNSCDKKSSDAEKYKRQIHKDHKCECCGKSFSQCQHLKGHIHKIHHSQYLK